MSNSGSGFRLAREQARTPTPDEELGMTWWNGLNHTERNEVLRQANAVKPCASIAEAWRLWQANRISMQPAKRHYFWHNHQIGRWVIQGHEIHCGDCFQARRDDGAWHNVRAEHDSKGWVLVGLPAGSNVRDFDLYEGRLYP